ncbi:triose-phosphate isomerase [Alkalimonas collagenimarina]|uniref:Triosephosphate isomerase n=1 Tax=Alkalimonas collagenimarina TaxID=400390 RepID=A0ABT9H1M0_9GAMM|nr:triose-phosphate isomerase [Alkalimonas collagenimarina]MDP4537113.1 triose-phosphate isomerase [Alkalimonas collagenimarina]
MTQRKPLVAANWKMNGSKALVDDMTHSLAVVDFTAVDVMICPPATLLPLFPQGTAIALGGQNLSQYDAGAYTGELSASLLLQAGARYVLVGHSERRSLFSEDDDILLAKVQQAVATGLIPVFCVGENLQQRQQEKTTEVLAKQLAAVYASHPELLAKSVIAYEPVWAIGTGEAATPEQAQQAHAAIRQLLARYDTVAASKVRILYGGSVNASNAAALFNEADIDGGLVGGASLKPAEFLEICRSAKD